MKKWWLLIFLLSVLIACDDSDKGIVLGDSPITNPSDSTDDQTHDSATTSTLSIFFINDPHSRLTNFAKIKHIVDAARDTTEVLLVAAGDIFSGSPYVDQYEPKGYPIIDAMNQAGFDMAVIGNHEFDYGIDILNDRINQSDFGWVCANIDTQGSELAQPKPFRSIHAGSLKVTFLGLVETNGQPGAIIPATHPWRVADVTFERYYDVVGAYENLKEEEEADLLIALTHLGLYDDQQLASHFPFFDAIIGGHTNNLSTEWVNGIPTLMAGGNLSHLGRVDFRVENHEAAIESVELIDLNAYSLYDEVLMQTLEAYQNNAAFHEIIGHASTHHNRNEVGCFYTEALATYMDVDISFQNGGGIRSDLNAGDISVFDIFSIDPFNNGSVIFTKTAGQVKEFFIETGVGLHVHGVDLERVGSTIVMRDEEGREISDQTELTIGINDYIPAVHSAYFKLQDAHIQELTTAETLVQYLKSINSIVAYEGCNHYFRY